ncbi:hypothetical protein TorRG33x02_083440 [Trema orientale]|uniref:Uncharacterized protein n=1 Tax=Trema orientale TaxID=63057 RepID=A0A2P5FDF2_TREOI|nr:hypothetical protein TorRG33x02_083440 [Trema orientale]
MGRLMPLSSNYDLAQFRIVDEDSEIGDPSDKLLALYFGETPHVPLLHKGSGLGTSLSYATLQRDRYCSFCLF